MEEETFLKRSQRINVLDVAGPAGHAGHNRVDVRLRELDQGQHLRGDGRGVGQGSGSGAAGAALSVCERARKSVSEPLQGRGREQGADLGGQPRLAKAIDERDGEEGMAAEFEEVVVAADAIEFEDVGPDAGDGGFQFTGGFFMTVPQVGIGLGRR